MSPRERIRGDLPPGEDVRRELEAHLDLSVQDLVEAGWDPAAARAEARRRLGDFEGAARAAEGEARARQRSSVRERLLDSLVHDVRFGLRSLRRSPSYTAVAVATLALGIGANSAVFSVVRGVLLRPLPYAEADRLVAISEVSTTGGSMAAAWPNVVDWGAQARGFAGLAPYGAGETAVLGGERPVRAGLVSIGRDFWKVFPVTPQLGRLTVADDHREGATPVVLVSGRFWRTSLGGAPDVLDRSVEVSGRLARVAGVLPEGFDFPGDADLWMPIELTPQGDSRSSHNWAVIGRLAPGVEVEAADRELDEITRRALAGSDEDPEYLAVEARVVPYLESVVGGARRPLALLAVAAALVLLIACTNLGSTLLARGSVRAGEMAVRASLGASRGRLARQLVVESALLAALGIPPALGLAVLGRQALLALDAGSLPRLDQVRLDGSVLAFTLAAAALAVLLFGLLPALRLSQARIAVGARGSRGSAARRGAGWSLLVGTEVALALLLVVGSALLLRSFARVMDQDAGFDPSDAVAAVVTPSRIAHPDAASVASVYLDLAARLAEDPSVSAVGVTTTAPFRGFLPNGRLELDGDLTKQGEGSYVAVSEGYFDALDIPLLQGRLFDARDDATLPHVVVVSRSFAERAWPGEDPIGRTVTGGGMDDHWRTRTFATVVGVVGDVRYRSLTALPVPVLYFSVRQRPFRAQWGATLIVEARGGDAADALTAYRRGLDASQPDIPFTAETLDAALGSSVAQRRFTLSVLASFAGVALVLALVGIYGVVSYAVERRTREMGIRLALGADAGGVLGLVVRGSMRAVAAGLVLGIVLALALGRLLRGLLFEVEPNDPVALTAAVTALAAAGLLASWIPARRAARIQPSIAIRAE